jgi:hypothetical protein
VTVAGVSVTEHTWLAGNPGPPLPAPVFFAIALIVVAVGFGASVLPAWTRRQREEPLRTELEARPVTFRSGVDVKARLFSQMASQHGPLYLNVYGDAFRVAHALPLAWFLFGQDYCYRAQDTTIEMVPGMLHDWIEISPQPAGSAAQIWIGRRKISRQLWDVLVNAGAHPIGSPPAP